MNIDPDLLSDDISSKMGTETLLAHEMVPEGLPASSKGPAEQQVHHIRGARLVLLEGCQLRTAHEPQYGTHYGAQETYLLLLWMRSR